MASKRVLILYYSGSGNTKKMAKAIAEGMESRDMSVRSENADEKFDVSSLPNYDCIILGSPTYFSNVAWQIKKVIDESIVHYSGGKLKGKVAGIFTSAGSGNNGKDCLEMLDVALGVHHRMKVVKGIIRVDGEDDKEVEKRCKEYGKKLLKEVEMK